MICPYCNLETIPVDLNGKLFCQNCGLSLGNSPIAVEEVPSVMGTSQDSQEDLNRTDERPTQEAEADLHDGIKSIHEF